MENFGIPVELLSREESIQVSALKPGTIVTVETMNSIYEIKIVKSAEVTISGGLMRDGSLRFPKPLPAMIVGANWGNSLKMGCITHGMRLAIDVSGDHVIETSPVMNVKLEGPGWNYSMGWNKDAQS